MQVLTTKRRINYNWFSFGSWFSLLEFREVTRTVADSAWSCAFWRNSFILNRALKTRLLVLVISWGVFFIPLLYTSSETWVIESSLTLGRAVFIDWRFVERSSWLCLANAANIVFYPNVALLERKWPNIVKDWTSFLFFNSNLREAKLGNIPRQKLAPS